MTTKLLPPAVVAQIEEKLALLLRPGHYGRVTLVIVDGKIKFVECTESWEAKE